MRARKYLPALTTIAFGVASLSHAQVVSTDTPSTSNDLQISITNAGTSSFSLTPLWFAFQDGSFDFFDVGSAASSSTEMLAEDGIVDGLVADFAASGVPGNRQGVAFAPDGFAGAPVIEPGETAVAYVTPINPANYQYFTYASMIIPSNDTFIGNDDPMQYQVFTPGGDINDASGVFTIDVFGRDLLDSGTEENLGDGAAFSTIGGTATDTVGGVIGPASDLSEFLNTTTPAGTTITELIAADDLVATIAISQIPEPSSLLIVILCGLTAGFAYRRKK